MNFGNLLHRSNLNTLETFITCGEKSFSSPPEGAYSERLKKASQNVTALFQARFPDFQDYDEVAGYYDKQVEVVQDIYFEIGLILGARIAFQISEKMEELK